MANGNTSVVQELSRNLTTAVLPVTIFIGVEALIGFFGNILILVIYTKRYERSNFRYFVLSMAVIDFTSCVTTLPGEIFSQRNWYTYTPGWVCNLKSYFNVLTVLASTSILFLLAFDRYRKVCRPLARQIRPSFALKLCVGSIIMSAVVAGPNGMLWGKQTYIYTYKGSNYSVSICEKSSMYADDIYPLIYIGCVYIVPGAFIFFVVCSLNFITARELFGKKSMVLNLNERELSSKNGSDSTLNTFVSETDLENVNVEIGNTKPYSNKDITKEGNINSSKEASLHRSASQQCVPISAPEMTTKVFYTDSYRTSAVSNANDIISADASLVGIHFDIEVKETRNISTQTSNRSKEPIKKNQRNSKNSDKSRDSKSTDFRRKRKTIIMLVLTSVYVVTLLIYVVLTSFVAGTEGILRTLSNTKKVVFFFFWRLYFINTIINPLLYGILDPRFRTGLKALFMRKG